MRGRKMFARAVAFVTAFVVVMDVGASPVEGSSSNNFATESDSSQSVEHRDNHRERGRKQRELEARAERNGHAPVIVSLNPPDNEDAMTHKERKRHYRAQRDALVERFGSKSVKALKSVDGAPFVALSADQSDLDVLAAAPEVQTIDEDGAFQLTGTTSFGAALGQQLPEQWDYKRIGADWANVNGWTGSRTAVVIIDTGVDRNNPYLRGRIVNEACFASDDNGRGYCPNGTGSSYSQTRGATVAGAAAPCTYNVAQCAHGTHVAHTAAGAYGVARGAKIVAIQASHRVWSKKYNAWVPNFRWSDVQFSLWYVHQVLKPKVGIHPAAVNMSIGSEQGYVGHCDDRNSWITYYINALKADYRIPVVISSGNGNLANAISKPACNSNAIAVGNTTLTSYAGVDAVLGNVDGGSNTSPAVDILAPGTDVCSAVPTALVATGWQCEWFGTSMAAPQVTGAIAILTQKWSSATVDQILSILQRSGSTGGQAVTDDRYPYVTRTRINVANALYYTR